MRQHTDFIRVSAPDVELTGDGLGVALKDPFDQGRAPRWSCVIGKCSHAPAEGNADASGRGNQKAMIRRPSKGEGRKISHVWEFSAELLRSGHCHLGRDDTVGGGSPGTSSVRS
jgi:hypothetical protein